ncbi:MAG: tetratricopeptide repeat protein [Corynebacterium sp.]|nr:tetratricopeptide repeat protein [Corynebacterium sp.]
MVFDLSTLAQKNEGNGDENTIFVNHENIEAEVLHKSRELPVVILVGSARSAASEGLRKDLGTLAGQANNTWRFAYIDADKFGDIAQMLGVQALPTVVALYQARPVASFQGGQSMENLQRWTAALVAKTTGGAEGEAEPEPVADPRFNPALEAMERGDFDAAIAVYDEILAKEPANKEAKAGRDNAVFLGRLNAQAQAGTDPLAALQANPEDIPTILAAADALVASGAPEAAFDLLIQHIKKTEAKDRLLELFALFDASDPRVMAARQKMASALF